MAYRDKNGHFIPEDEARRQGLTDEPDQGIVEGEFTEEEDAGETMEDRGVAVTTPIFGAAARARTQEAGIVYVVTDKGQSVEAHAGDPFVPTIERIADEAHYGGDFRVFLNGNEILEQGASPGTIQLGQRIRIVAYDKPGLN